MFTGRGGNQVKRRDIWIWKRCRQKKTNAPDRRSDYDYLDRNAYRSVYPQYYHPYQAEQQQKMRV